jgi:hypothetical protein
VRPRPDGNRFIIGHFDFHTVHQLNELEFAVNGPDLQHPTARAAFCQSFVIGVRIVIEIHLKAAG